MAAEARRAASASQTAQAVAAGAAVTEFHGQERAGAAGGDQGRSRATPAGDSPTGTNTPADVSTAGGGSERTEALNVVPAAAEHATGAVAASRDASGGISAAVGGNPATGVAGAGSPASTLAVGDDPGSATATADGDDTRATQRPSGPGDPTAAGPSAGDEDQAVASGAVEAYPAVEAHPAVEAYPEESDDWAWEARWAEEERQARERDDDATQIVDPSAAGIVDDRPHLVPGFDRYEDRQPVDDDDPTIFVHIGTAETTLLTPGVRPTPASPEPPADDDEPTVPGRRLNAAPVPDDADPGDLDRESAAATSRGSDEPTTSVIASTADTGEPTTSFLAGGPAYAGHPAPPPGDGPAADDATTSFVVGGPVSGDPTVSLTADGSGSGEPTTFLVPGGPASGDPTVSLAADGSGSGEPTTSFVPGSPVSGDPTVSLAADGPDVDEPTTTFVVHGSPGGRAAGADGGAGSDPDDDLPTTVITRGTDTGQVTVVQSPPAGDGDGDDDSDERTVESR